MNGTSKIIMGATLVMMVSLAMVLALVLVLLAELYCSLLLRRRHHQATNSTTPTAATTTTTTANSSNQTQIHPASLTNIYSHGVLRAPRTLLFPAPFDKHVADIEKPHHSPPTQHLNQTNTLNQTSLLLNPQSPSSISVEKTPVLSAAHSNKHMVDIEKTHHSPQNQTLKLTSPTNQDSLLRTPPRSPSTSPQETPFQPLPSLGHFNEHLVGMEKTHHSPSNPTSPINQTSLVLTPPHASSSGPLQETPFQPLPSLAHFNKHFMGIEKTHRSPPPQILNPTPTQVPFQCDSNRTSITDTDSDNLVYISNPIYDNEEDTPFETPDTSPSRLGGEGSSGEEGSPAVTPMKKLPADGCSVSLRDLGTSGSEDSNYSKNGGYSSSSGSPCTSPSW